MYTHAVDQSLLKTMQRTLYQIYLDMSSTSCTVFVSRVRIGIFHVKDLKDILEKIPGYAPAIDNLIASCLIGNRKCMFRNVFIVFKI